MGQSWGKTLGKVGARLGQGRGKKQGWGKVGAGKVGARLGQGRGKVGAKCLGRVGAQIAGQPRARSGQGPGKVGAKRWGKVGPKSKDG